MLTKFGNINKCTDFVITMKTHLNTNRQPEYPCIYSRNSIFGSKTYQKNGFFQIASLKNFTSYKNKHVHKFFKTFKEQKTLFILRPTLHSYPNHTKILQ